MVVAKVVPWLAGAALAGALGCAHTEGEYRARVREIDELKALVAKAEEREGVAKRAADDAASKSVGMERELRAAGLDPAAIGAGAEQQARALEVWRRRAAQLAAASRRLQLLRDGLAPHAKSGVEVTVRDNRIVIRLPGDALFETGRESLRRDGKELVAAVGRVIRSDPSLSARTYQVAGHLDLNRPGGAFKDGWGLSAMRAREVLALLVTPVERGGGGVSPARWSAAGHGDSDPRKADDTPEARAQNRRCEIVEVPAPEEMLDLSGLVPQAKRN